MSQHALLLSALDQLYSKNTSHNLIEWEDLSNLFETAHIHNHSLWTYLLDHERWDLIEIAMMKGVKLFSSAKDDDTGIRILRHFTSALQSSESNGASHNACIFQTNSSTDSYDIGKFQFEN